jgi:hypothetical protein
MFEFDGSARVGGALAPSMLLRGFSVKRSGLKALLRAYPEFKLLLAGSIMLVNEGTPDVRRAAFRPLKPLPRALRGLKAALRKQIPANAKMPVNVD